METQKQGKIIVFLNNTNATTELATSVNSEQICAAQQLRLLGGGVCLESGVRRLIDRDLSSRVIFVYLMQSTR